MKQIIITTPENIEIKYTLAGLGSRLGAAIVDLGIQIIALVFFTTVILSLFYDFDNIEYNDGVIGLILILFFIIAYVYYVFFEFMFNGQTLGKKIFRLRAIRNNGQAINFSQVLSRNLTKIFIDNTFGVLVLFLSKENKRIGDYLAGTLVISENSNRMKEDKLKMFSILDRNNKLSFEDKLVLSRDEIEVLNDFFQRKIYASRNGIVVTNELIRYFSKRLNLNEEMITLEYLHTFIE